MKKTWIVLTMVCSIIVVASCLTALAQDVSTQVRALEQKAERMQSQINLAKQQGDMNLDAQIKTLRTSVDSLLGQRVQLDAHIARLEGQIEDLKQSSTTSVNRQVKEYEAELGNIRQQIGSLMSTKDASAAKKSDESKPATGQVGQ